MVGKPRPLIKARGVKAHRGEESPGSTEYHEDKVQLAWSRYSNQPHSGERRVTGTAKGWSCAL